MKRMAVLCLMLAICITATACCPLTFCGTPFQKEESPTTVPAQTNPTENSDWLTQAPTTTTTTEAPTTTTTTVSHNHDTKPVNYPLPVANPDKKLYDAPDGNLVGTVSTIGYYTVVEQATDADGYTWGRLSGSPYWTLVYHEILPELDMYFSSGVGGWGTSLKIQGKGTFSGSYHDSDMGDTGDGYPNGTCYVCDFTGSFRVTDIKDYTITLEMTSLTSKKAAGTTWIEDGVQYVASGAYGLEGGTEFILYTPNTPISQIPEEALSWSYDLPESGTLDCYALYCPALGTAFFG